MRGIVGAAALGLMVATAACLGTGTANNGNGICQAEQTRSCTCYFDAGVGTQACTPSGNGYTECTDCHPAGVGSSSTSSGASSSSSAAVSSSSAAASSSSSTGSGGSSGNGCDPRARLIYVVDQDHTLSSFDPVSLSFEDIGWLNCPAQPLAETFSMAVQRNATAWVLYGSGELFRVNTSTAACSATSYVPGQDGMEVFGMGFVANQSGSVEETLHVAGGPVGAPADSNRTLGSINLTTLQFTGTGTVGGSPELTGTADARLYGFFPSAFSPRAALLNKFTGLEVESYALPGLVGTPQAWAFAFWGGSFWIFLMRSIESSTWVYRMDVVNGQPVLSTALSGTGRVIVGAGVSTCAPLLR